MRTHRRNRKLALYGAVLAGAAVVYLATRPSTPGARTSGAGPLYRIHVRAPLAYVADVRRRVGAEGQKALLADVRRRVESLGYEGTLTTIQDPTDNSRLTLVTHPSGRTQRTTDGVVSIERVERVLPPGPQATRSSSVGVGVGVGAVDPRTARLPLEPWLTADEAFAVRRALSEEMSTRHLKGLASVFEPRAPVAASMLRAKATVLDPRRADADPRPADERVRDLFSDLLAPTPTPDPTLLARVDAGRRAVEGEASLRGIPLDLAHDDVRRAAYHASARGVASAVQTGASAAAVSLGVLLVRPLPHGGAVVDPVLASRACPETGRERFVSPSALWLAHAAGKPQVSGVGDPDRIQSAYESTDAPNPGADPKADAVRRARATSMMQRAEKTLQRDRWIRWYRRRAETD